MFIGIPVISLLLHIISDISAQSLLCLVNSNHVFFLFFDFGRASLSY